MRLLRVLVLGTFLMILAPGYSVQADSTNPALQRCKPGGTASAANLAENPAAETTSVAPPSLYVVTTVAPLTNLVFNIGGNRIKIHGLIPEGADSHTFEPKPSDAVF